MLREIPTQVATKIAINNKAQQWRNDREIMFENGNKHHAAIIDNGSI
jgi:hypothetical protein